MKIQPSVIVKRSIPLLLIVAVLCSVFAVSASAKSGDKTVSSPTPAQIIERYKSIRPVTSVYDVKPTCKAPYAAGELSDSLLNNALDYLNYVRWLAGLPSVTMDEAMNNEAQHGAVLLAATDQFTHYPQKPADMSQAFFDKGYSATTSANLAGLYTVSESTEIDEKTKDYLREGIHGCMEDDTSGVNLLCVGHRRWQLNPWLKYVGFGFANHNGGNVSVIKCHDYSGRQVDYDYVAWPPAGYCPSNEFQTTVPWSVSLNPNVYGGVDPDAVKVTIRNHTTGETWTVDKNTPLGTIGEAYLSVDCMGYGEGDCIIFMPGYPVNEDWTIPIEERMGEYSVVITGLTYRNGAPATISYTTEFFDMEAAMKLTITKQPQDAKAALGEVVKTTVTASGAGLRYQWYVKEPGTKTWLKSSVKTATYSYEMTKAKSGRQVYCVITDAFGKSVTSDTVTLEVKTPCITKQPKDVIVNVGSTAKTSVTAYGEGLRYQWYFKNPGMGTFAKSSVTTASYSYVMTPEKSGRQVYCRITDEKGDVVKSKVVTLRMPRPKFTVQPQNATAPIGGTAVVTAAGSGKGISYQWYYKNPGATKFLKSSVKTDTYTLQMTKAKAGRQVYCVITDQYGQKVQSDTVTLSIPKIKITAQPKSASAAIGQTVKTTVTAKGDGLRYQWYFKNADMTKFQKSSVTTASYSYVMTAAKAGRQAYCVITDQYGNTVKTATVTFRNT